MSVESNHQLSLSNKQWFPNIGDGPLQDIFTESLPSLEMKDKSRKRIKSCSVVPLIALWYSTWIIHSPAWVPTQWQGSCFTFLFNGELAQLFCILYLCRSATHLVTLHFQTASLSNEFWKMSIWKVIVSYQNVKNYYIVKKLKIFLNLECNWIITAPWTPLSKSWIMVNRSLGEETGVELG